MLVHFISDCLQNLGQNEASVVEAVNENKVEIHEAMEDFKKFCLALETKYSSNEVNSEISDGNRLKIVASCKDAINWLKGTSKIKLHDIKQQKSKILELQDEIIKNKSDCCLVECPDDADGESPNNNAGMFKREKEQQFHLIQ